MPLAALMMGLLNSISAYYTGLSPFREWKKRVTSAEQKCREGAPKLLSFCCQVADPKNSSAIQRVEGLRFWSYRRKIALP
jgi:hypothetical protein